MDQGLSPEDEEQLADWLLDWEDSQATTTPKSPEEIASSRPELLSEFKARIAALCRFNEWAMDTADQSDTHDGPPKIINSTQAYLRQEKPVKLAGSTSEFSSFQIGRYLVLEEIARGGMGVVYKAEDRQLGRIVAIKLIKAGELATKDAISRFYVEAQAAGNLEHPGIVQVFEVGQQGHEHYLAMAYIDGQSLWQRVKEGPLKPRDAARLIQQIADAIQHAHNKGIIHRDLKPHNILLTKTGQPKVTDFGLAKRPESDSNLTATGQVMGTPSFMPPEQAQGRTNEIGQLADVYSLGATFYCLLTGRPPFQAATVVETMKQVIEQEPVSPRLLNPTVDKDLETLCLKCLEKNPQNRLGSAQALADELGRYLRGEPIRSRPVSQVARGYRWVRRNPLATGLIVSLLIGISALGITMMLLKQASNSQLNSALRERLQKLIDEPELTATYLELGENLIAQIESVSPGNSRGLEDRLWGAFANTIEKNLKRAQIAPQELEQYATPVELLSRREAKRAKELQELLDRRSQSWQRVFDLKPPFAELRDVYSDERLRVVNDFLESSSVNVTNTATVPTIRSELSGKGSVRLEATFDSRWRSAKELSLDLSSTNQAGYRITLVPPVLEDADTNSANVDDSSPSSIPQEFIVRFDRNGKVLSKQSFPAGEFAKESELTVRATRQGRKLSLQLGTGSRVTFEDPFPLPGSMPLRFGISLPAGVGVKGLTASQMSDPGGVAALENGDYFYDREDWSEAWARYQQEELNATSKEISAECRYKQALCLIAMGRREEAIAILESCFTAEQSRWSILAGTQLWLQLLRQKQTSDAQGVFERLSQIEGSQSIAGLVPDDIRNEILHAYRTPVPAGVVLMLSLQTEVLDQFETQAKVQALLGSQGAEQLETLHRLLNGYFVTGQYEKAWNVNQQIKTISVDDWVLSADVRIKRLQGRLQEALELANQYTFDDSGRVKSTRIDRAPGFLRIQRVFCLAAMGDWDAVERELVSLKDIPTDHHHPGWQAALMQYYLLSRKGDLESAREALRRSMPVENSSGQKNAPNQSWISGRQSSPEQFCIRGLAADIPADELKLIFQRFEAEGAGVIGSVVGSFLKPESLVTPIRELFRSPKGTFAIEQYILDQGYDAERFQQLVAQLVVEFARANAFEGTMTPSQERVLEDIATDLFKLLRNDRLFVTTQLIPLATTWKGVTNLLGWKSISYSLPPKRKQNFAYLFAHRFLTLNNRGQAIEFLKEASAAKDGDPDLASLANQDIGLLSREQGMLEIENAHHEAVSISIRRPGQQDKQMTVPAGAGITMLEMDPGEVVIEAAPPQPAINLSATHIAIKPGRHSGLRITSVWAVDERLQPLKGLVHKPARLPGVCRWQMIFANPDYWTAMALSPDGSSIALGDDAGFVRIHRVTDFSLQHIFSAEAPRVTILQWNANGDILAAVSDRNSKIRLWDQKESKLGVVFDGQRVGIVQSIAWSPNRDRLASAGYWGDSAIRLNDPNQIGGVRSEDLGFVRALCWIHSGGQLAVGSNLSPELRVHGEDLKPIYRVPNPEGQEIFSLTWHPHRKLLASSTNHSTQVYRIPDESQKPELLDSLSSGQNVSSMSWDQDGSRLLTGSVIGTVQCLELQSGKLRLAWKSSEPSGESHVGWLDSGKGEAISLRSSRLTKWGTEGEKIDERQPEGNLLTSVEICPDGVICGGRNGEDRVSLFDLAGKKLLLFSEVRSRQAPCFSPDGRYCAIADEKSKRIRIYEIQRDWSNLETEFIELPASFEQVRSLAWNGNSNQIAVCLQNGKVWVCHLDKSTSEEVTLPDAAIDLAWQPRGNLLAIFVQGSTRRLIYWDARTKQIAVNIESPVGQDISQMDWSPDGEWLATAYAGGAVFLSDAQGRAGPNLDTFSWGPAHFCWSENSQRLAAVGGDRECRVWTIDGQLRQTLADDRSSHILRFDANRNEILFWSKSGFERRSTATGKQLQSIVAWGDGRSLELGATGEILRISPGIHDRIRFLVESTGQRLEALDWKSFEDRIGMALGGSGL